MMSAVNFLKTSRKLYVLKENPGKVKTKPTAKLQIMLERATCTKRALVSGVFGRKLTECICRCNRADNFQTKVEKGAKYLMKSRNTKTLVKSSQDETSVPRKPAEVFQRNVTPITDDFWPPSLAQGRKMCKTARIEPYPAKT